jgi:hypothetical protein
MRNGQNCDISPTGMPNFKKNLWINGHLYFEYQVL